MVVVGPEFVTGVPEWKQVLHKIGVEYDFDRCYDQLGQVKGNKMVDMQLSNNKLVDRGTQMLMDELMISQAEILFAAIWQCSKHFKQNNDSSFSKHTDKNFC